MRIYLDIFPVLGTDSCLMLYDKLQISRGEDAISILLKLFRFIPKEASPSKIHFFFSFFFEVLYNDWGDEMVPQPNI